MAQFILVWYFPINETPKQITGERIRCSTLHSYLSEPSLSQAQPIILFSSSVYLPCLIYDCNITKSHPTFFPREKWAFGAAALALFTASVWPDSHTAAPTITTMTVNVCKIMRKLSASLASSAAVWKMTEIKAGGKVGTWLVWAPGTLA